MIDLVHVEGIEKMANSNRRSSNVSHIASTPYPTVVFGSKIIGIVYTSKLADLNPINLPPI